MIDDLISRKAALEAVKIPNGEYPNHSERHGIIIARVEARRRIREIPSVPAVPLDKLCELIAYIGHCPPDNETVIKNCDIGNCEMCWKDYLTKWMEEQNA